MGSVDTLPETRHAPAMPVDLDAYLERVGFEGTPKIDEDTLFALHAAHLASIPYENLDIQLGRCKPLEEASFEQRLVAERRGGWCYEMNGLFSAALREIGFRVDRLGGAIVRDVLGDASIGHHMVLSVDLGHRLIADVGLGDGPLYPFPLEPRRWTEHGFHFELARTDDGWWRFHNQEHGLAPRFDFQETPWELVDYAPSSHFLHQPDSPFVGLAMMFRRWPTRIRAVRDLTLFDIEGSEKTERRIASRDEYAEIAAELVGLRDDDAITALWERISTRVAERAAAKSDAQNQSGDIPA